MPHGIKRLNLLLDGGERMRTRGEGGLEKIGHIWYFTFYNLKGKQMRRSSKSRLKSVAIEMLQQAQKDLRKGTEPASARKMKYEDIRRILVDDYLLSAKAVMDGKEILISGRRGLLKPLDDYFGGMNVANITTDVLRDFSSKRMENGVAGPTVNRNLAMLRRMFKLAERESKRSEEHTSELQSRGHLVCRLLLPLLPPSPLFPYTTLFRSSGRRGLLKPLDDYFGGMNVANITTDVLRDFSSKRMENGVAGPTVNRNLAMLRRMFKLAERESKVSNVPYFPMQKESEPREAFLEGPRFEKLRAEMPELLRPTLTFCYETGCRTGAMAKVVWPWVNLADQEISLPPGVVKNRKPIVPLSDELTAMLKKKFRGHGTVFATRNFPACVDKGMC